MLIRILATLLIFAAAPAYAKMYRCGNTYSQTPCGEDAKVVDIAVTKNDPGGILRILEDESTEETKAKQVARCQEAVKDKLKDPESAQFTKVERYKPVERRLPGVDNGPVVKTVTVSGYVNAKNSMGGYTGRKLFFCMVDYDVGQVVFSVNIF